MSTLSKVVTTVTLLIAPRARSLQRTRNFSSSPKAPYIAALKPYTSLNPFETGLDDCQHP